MSLLYLEEHTSCSGYVSALNTGFRFIDLKQGDELTYNEEKRFNILIFLTKGRASILRDDKTFVMKEGNICLCDTQYYANFSLKAEQDCQIAVHYFDIPLEFCQKLALESLYQYITEKESNPDEIKFLPIHKNIADSFLPPLKLLMESGARCKHLLELKHQELFFFFRFFYTKQQLADFFHPLLSPSLDFRQVVLANYRNAVTIKQLAELCHYSDAAFKAEFLKNFGETPYSWFSRQRLAAIEAKLKDKNIPFSAIIEDFNFSSPAHFTTYCKKNLGKTPKDWRREFSINR